MNPLITGSPVQEQAQMAYTDYKNLAHQDHAGEEGLARAAQQFESLFIDWVLKSMREANATLAEGSYLSSSEVEMHEKMLDHQTAMNLSSSGGLGLQALIMDQLRGGTVTQEDSTAADNPEQMLNTGPLES
ncbi:MAG: rod-binding protein [Pseudomonadales bacterium]